MQNTSNADKIASKIRNEKCYLIGICGIPGAGKSTLSQKLSKLLDKSVIVPFDGFHKYRKELDENGMIYRGAPYTFNLQSFKEKITKLKNRKDFPIFFPTFDHAEKDPVEDQVKVTSQVQHVIVEGLYIFDKSLNLESIWDIKIWIETDLDKSMQMTAKRNFQAGISPTLEQSKQRTNKNDRKNAIHILENSNKQNSLIITNDYCL